MKLNDYYVAQPLVSAIEELEDLINKIKEGEDNGDISTVKLVIFTKGTNQYSSGSNKTITVKNPAVQKIVVDGVKSIAQNEIKEYKKKLNGI